MSGTPFTKVDKPNIKLQNDGLPYFTYYLNGKIRKGDRDDLRIIFTMLNLTRGIILDPINDFKTITDPWKGDLPKSWKAFRTAVKKSLNIKRMKYHFSSLHTSTKSGPNGQAMMHSIHDLLSLTDEQSSLIKELGGERITSIFDSLYRPHNAVPTYQHWLDTIELKMDKPPINRKLSTFGDKEGKTRVIGIMDY
jgi:hypothetical protein